MYTLGLSERETRCGQCERELNEWEEQTSRGLVGIVGMLLEHDGHAGGNRAVLCSALWG